MWPNASEESFSRVAKKVRVYERVLLYALLALGSTNAIVLVFVDYIPYLKEDFDEQRLLILRPAYFFAIWLLLIGSLILLMR